MTSGAPNGRLRSTPSPKERMERMTDFGPEYTKINTLYKRVQDRRNVIIPGEFKVKDWADYERLSGVKR